MNTSGGDLDLDGYDVVLDGARRQLVFTDATVPIGNVPPGPHTLTLDRVAENCAVSGSASKSVQVAVGDTVDVLFEVVCVATGISITTQTTGEFAPLTYSIVANGLTTTIPVNGETVLGRLEPGSYLVELVINGNHCTVDGGPRVSVDVRAREVSTVAFAVTCVPPIRVPKIAFVFDSIMNGVRTEWIGLVELDGSNETRVGPGRSPDWSPDGSKLVYSDATCTDYYYQFCSGGVVVMDPETQTTYRHSEGTASFEPAWAPTNDAMVVVRCCSFLQAPGILWVVSLAGQAPAVRLATTEAGTAINPAWSPDGRQIAFSCMSIGRRDICVVGRDGSGFRRLTTGGVANADPTWSPDGSRIAFSTGAGIAVTSVADRTVTNLTSGYTPAWSPDGTQLAFARDDGLYIINADGTGARRLTSGRRWAPAWRPR